jgi:hypothetical protein
MCSLLLMIGLSRAAAAPLAPALAPLPAPPANALLARVRGPGLLVISGQQLAAAGWDLATLDPTRLQVWRRAAQVPIALDGTADGRLDPSDQLRLLVGDGTRWSAEEVYWIVPGDGPGLRGDLVAQPRQPLRWEPDAVYLSLLQAARGDRWFAGELRDGGPPLTMTLDLPAALPAGRTLSLAVTSLNRQAHQLVLSVYGQPYRLPAWSTTAASAGRPAGLHFSLPRPLPAGPLTLLLTLDPATPDAVAIDSLTIPDSLVPLPILAATLEQPMIPLLATDGATQVIIAHRDFHAALAPLVAVKARLGRSAHLIDPDAIYARYSWGERDPEAIRAFLADAHARTLTLRSVLLVGAGGLRQRAAAPDELRLVPPYLIDSDPVVGEIPCDTCYARGASADVRTDPLPALAVGRFPAHTLADLETLVAKTVTALESPPPGDWRRRQLVVTDNDLSADGQPDLAGPFTPLAEQLATWLPDHTATSFRYDPSGPAVAAPRYATPATLRRAFFKAFDDGAALLTYIGHASPWQWAAVEPNAEPAYLVSTYDSQRENGGRLPILLSMSCLSGQWTNTVEPTVDARLLLAEGGGVVASLSPTGSGVGRGHAALLGAVVPALAEGRTLGDAFLAGLTALDASGRDGDLRFSYALLGDPDVALPPMAESVYLPLVQR